MMRDDFCLFDSYEYVKPPAFLKRGEFPIPMQAKYLTDDQRCKKEHLMLWQAFTSEKVSFTAEECGGNHLFFYDNPARAAWMESIIRKLPKEFAPPIDIA